MKFSKTFKNDLATAQKEYIKILEKIKIVEQIEKECKLKVLNENNFYDASTTIYWERILDPRKDFLMKEEQFIEYCKLVYEEEIKRGLKVADYNTTATKELKETLKEKEIQLFNLGIKTIPEGLQADIKKAFNNYKLKKEALELMSQLDVATL